jgi:hypothetical protein
MMIMISVFALCRFVGWCQSFGGTYRLHLRDFSPENGDNIFLRNVYIYLWIYTGPKPRASSSSSSSSSSEIKLNSSFFYVIYFTSHLCRVIQIILSLCPSHGVKFWFLVGFVIFSTGLMLLIVERDCICLYKNIRHIFMCNL